MRKNEKKQLLTEAVYTDLVHTSSNMVRSAILETLPSIDYSCLDDLENDVWLRVWEKRDQFKGTLSSLTTWVYNIAVSVTQNYIRDYINRAPDIVSERTMEAPVEEYESWIEQNSIDYDDPEALLLAEQEAAIGYDGLSPQEERVFDLMYMEGLSAQETADRLGLAHSTVRVVARNIRNKINQL